MPRLRENIISVFRNVYGMAGDEVKVIADYDTVMIVEDADGIRFPVQSDKLTYDAAPIKAQALTKKVNVQPAKAAKSKPAVILQQNLF